MAKFGATEVAAHAVVNGLLEQSPDLRAVHGQIGLFATGLSKALKEGDNERIVALIEGVDLEAEALARVNGYNL